MVREGESGGGSPEQAWGKDYNGTFPFHPLKFDGESRKSGGYHAVYKGVRVARGFAAVNLNCSNAPEIS